MTTPLNTERLPDLEMISDLYAEMTSARNAGLLAEEVWEALVAESVQAETVGDLQTVREKFKEEIDEVE